MLDPNLTERIRAIFLHREAGVTGVAPDEAAWLLGMTREELAAAAEQRDVETVRTCRGVRIEADEIAEQALHRWPVVTIEEALGREAVQVLPDGVRTRRFAVRLPRYLIAALERLAEENGESAEALLARELHGLAWEHRERLAAVIPGFAEAVAWSFGGEAGPVS